MARRRRRVHTEQGNIMLEKMANGWQVIFPFNNNESIELDYDYNPALDAMINHPVFDRLIKLAERKLAGDDYAEPEPTEEAFVSVEAHPIFGIGYLEPSPNIFVFEKLEQALDFIKETIEAEEQKWTEQEED